MQLSESYKQNELVISFELFPPKTTQGETKLFEQAIPDLLKLSPEFITCTYGAGGSTRRNTLQIVSRLKNEVGAEAVSHLSCIGMPRRSLQAYLERAAKANISNIVAIRGDLPEGDTSFKPAEDGLKYGNELTALIKEVGGFDVAVAAYPEGHPECPDKLLDWQRCLLKVEAGADVIITQLFYDNNDFFEFDDYLKNKLGITIPIVPGVLPILNLQQIQRICGLCGANIPAHIIDRLQSYGDDKEAARKYGVEVTTEMCEKLLDYGIPGIHFYTLNRADSTTEVMQNLGLLANRPQAVSS